jgi:hypothetical protein
MNARCCHGGPKMVTIAPQLRIIRVVRLTHLMISSKPAPLRGSSRSWPALTGKHSVMMFRRAACVLATRIVEWL